MNRLRSVILMNEPRHYLHRRRTKLDHPRSARTRSQLPLRHPVALRGRDVSTTQRILSGWRGILPDVLLTLLFITMSFAVSVQQVEKTPFHPDESRWMNRAYYARELSDPFGPAWQEYVTTIGQPPLGSIVMGIGLAIQGHDLDATGSWDFAYGTDWNKQMGAMPSDEDRFAARRTNVVIGALVTGAVYVLGRLLTNRTGGAVAAAFIAWHPLHVVLSTQALSDQTLALLLALIFIAGWCFAKKPTWTRAIILGILLGLGGSVKLTPLLLAGPLAAFGVIRWLVHRDARSRRYAWMMLAQPIIAFAIFVLSYPFLWPNPIARTWRLYTFRAQEMDDQSAAWPETAVSGPLDSLGRFGERLTYVDSTSRRALTQVYDWLGIDRIPAGLDLIPAIAGIVILLWWVARKGFWTPAAMVALLMGAEAGALVVGMKTDFYRYHLPILVIMAGCIGVSTGTAWSMTHRIVHRWRQGTLFATASATRPADQTSRREDPQTGLSAPASGEFSR
jgi:4-amino-4-deoxy-L-arabinose transferase-like glycosyltransferase